MRFNDKVVVCTGSSSGIGRETLLMMAKEGALVTMHGVTQKHIDVSLLF
jgi:NAD(P)-dependent dehydrogenase (short-subunit alcohol dehydrogenase family)